MIRKGQLIGPVLKFRVDAGSWFSHLTAFIFDPCGPVSTRIARRRHIHVYLSLGPVEGQILLTDRRSFQGGHFIDVKNL